MAWSYGGDLSVSELDAVRFEITDTNTNDQLLQNEEIQFALDQESSVLGAAARCCEVIARKLARVPDRKIGGTTISNASSVKVFMDLAKDLRKRSTMMNGVPYAGGIYKEDTEAYENNPALNKPYFDRKMHDYYQTANTDRLGY
jgi:hypothetical protein